MAPAPQTTSKESPRRRREPARPPASPTRRKGLQLLLVFITTVLVIDALVGEKGLIETVRARRQHRELTASIERIRAENAQLRDEVRRLTDDPWTIESLARQELGLIRPGELLFIVKDARPGRSSHQR
jgi:cell division protein FtsB